MVNRLWIIGSIVLVAALVFLVCALAFFVATRFVPLAGSKASKETAKNALPAAAPGRTG